MNPVEKATRKAVDGLVMGVAKAYRANEDRMRGFVENHLANTYDDKTANFIGGEMEILTQRNYEKALANVWKAEISAPYLGFRDASNLERKGATSPGEIQEIDKMMKIAQSKEVRARFEAATTPEQREAVGWIMSLMCHGEAYALYTSSTLLPVVTGTGARMGMSLQVMEEAKHFIVLRELLRQLGIMKPLKNSARFLFETIARQKQYNKLFGMNVVLESFATNIFAHFGKYPGFEDIVEQFHRDESRHVGFPQNYNQAGNIPEWVTKSKRAQVSRFLMLLTATGVLFDYRPYFEALGIDAFGFFGKFIAKMTRLAERAGMPLPQKREDVMMGFNLGMNSYLMKNEPENYHGFKDYTVLSAGEIDPEMEKLEREIYGNDVFGGIGRERYEEARAEMEREWQRLHMHSAAA